MRYSGLGLAGALVFALVAAGGCGRSELFSVRRCAANDIVCQQQQNHPDGGGSPDGKADGADGRTDGTGNRDLPSDRRSCPTGNREICGNGIDDDCNGLVDCADPACFGDRACSNPGQEICNNGIDDDGNGLIDCADPACMGSLACKPTMGMEICDNGVDDNGDGLVDCSDPQCTKFPACLTVDCTPDLSFGAIAQHGASVTRTIDTRGAAQGYATCAPSGGRGRVAGFSLAQTTDVRVDFAQAMGGAHVVGLFAAGANQTCDRNPIGCLSAGQAPTATQTFAALPAGSYWLIVESFPNTQGSTTVTLSTGSATKMEICNNGIDDDGNGLIDCQDLACVNSPSCVGSECMPDITLGALVIDAPPKSATVDLSTSPDRYRPTCAGQVPGGDRAISFTLPEAGGIEVAYQQTGGTIFSLFQDPGPGLNCDASQIACAFEEQRANAIAFSEQPAGRYILIVKAISNAQAGQVAMQISAFRNRRVEVCGNGIDDDGNGLIDCADPACFGIGSCSATGCNADADLGAIGPGTVRSTTLDTTSGMSLYQTSCSRGNGKERVVRLSLTQPEALGISCTDTGSHVLELAQQLQPLDMCNANEIGCADPATLPFGCGYSIPGLQPGNYYLIVQAFQAGDEGVVQLTLDGERETVREICDNGIDDDGDGFIDCADRKCVTSPLCQKFACRPDKTLGLLPLDGSLQSTVVQTTMAGDDQMHTSCVSAPGGQDAVVDFQLPATADVTMEWAQVGQADFALYTNDGPLLACDAGTQVTCLAPGTAAVGMHVFTALPSGKYHLVVDADHPGAEGGVVLQVSAVASP
jgi:hypothetical protein